MSQKKTIELSAANFDQVLEDNDIVLLDFWASWCGPCRAFGPIFEKAAEKHPDIAFAKVNTEEQQELAGKFGIRSIPTVGIMRDKVLLFLQPGVVPDEALDDLIAQTRKLDMEEVKREIAEQQQQAAN